MAKILAVAARQILDSRGNPTVECIVKTGDGLFTASVPSGASTGTHEAHELRDGGKAYLGKGVEKAVRNVNVTIAKKLKGKDPSKQQQIDELLIATDGTADKRKLGANAILAASMAVCRAGAAANALHLYEHLGSMYGNKTFTLPVPALNIINGGKHAGNKLDIQEYMIIPVGAKSFAEAMQISTEIYHMLKQRLAHRFGNAATNVGDEGGFAPNFECMEEPFDYITDTIIKLGYWKKVKLGIDAAASTFYKHNKYYLEGQEYTPDHLLQKYAQLAESYPLASIEDPFHEEDFMHFAQLIDETGIQIVADDLTVTNPQRVHKAIAQGSGNCLLLKANQIGTITETLRAARLAQDNTWNTMVSHRSGETTDHFIADLAVGINSGQIKAGAPCRGERLAKYNELLRLEEHLGRKARYAGKTLKF